MPKPINMTELARLAEVDISTVSRALNDSPLVKPATRERIQRIAKETGYVVNATASNLRRQSSGALGMVIPLAPGTEQTMSDPFFLEMVGAVSQAAAERDYDLVVSVPKSATQISEKRLLQTGRADGLIVIGQADRIDRLNELAASQTRFVVWGGRIANTKYTVVGSDNRLGGELATRHLLERGRRRFLFLGDPDLPEVMLRYEGFTSTLADAGLGEADHDVLTMNFGDRSTYDQVSDHIAQGGKFDGIFAASDRLAISAIHALGAAGLRVPDDVSVVGFDNIGQAEMVAPSLTTVSQDIANGGRILVELVLAAIEGRRIRSRYTKTSLIVRDSS